MSTKVTVNPPKTPVTEGSDDIAAATTPNVCKMPGPPPPFVPTPLPNIGKSSDNLTDGTTTVKMEDNKVAIKGTSYKSTGSPDAASKGTGGGVVSSTEEGKTEFTAPGSMNVKAEGKNIQLLGDAMTNNNMNGGATLPGNVQPPLTPAQLEAIIKKCVNSAEDSVNNEEFPNNGTPGNRPTAAQCAENNGDRARELGEKKHQRATACVQAAIPPGQQNQVSAAQPYQGSVANNNLQTTGAPGTPPGPGGAAPDFVLHAAGNPAAGITGVFEMKFPCPRGRNLPRWALRAVGLSQGEVYALMFSVVPRLIGPFARVVGLAGAIAQAIRAIGS